MIQSLGYVTLPSPPTPTRATANRTDPTLRVATQALIFQALPTNTGKIYVGTASMNTTTGVGVFGVIPAPTDATTGPFPSWSPSLPVVPAALNAGEFYIDGDNGGEGVIVTLVSN
jgi:hypothetical protein